MRKSYFLLIVFFVIFGCVYYNTLFNAKKLFKEAEDIRKTQGVTRARNKYNSVIKKCAYIVKEYKNNKYADDALFLLSKALFYKGTNYTQAIENFEQLIEFYPKSKFIPEAKIYIARANYHLNKKGEAYTELQNIVNSTKIEKKYKSQAMLILAKYYSQDENYEKAIYYLKKLIDEYKNTKEYQNALVMLGEIYYKQKNFKKSLEIFTKISNQKRFEKKIKADALYYIALNNFELNNTQKALEIISKLLLKERRASVIPKLRILNARILIQKGEYNKAINLLKAVIKDNRRTLFSAEAAYRIAEVYFNYLKNYEKAIEYYNKVKTENRKSEFNEDAIIKSAIASQIIQYLNPPKNIEPLKLIEQQMKLAEYYFDILDKPDSTMKIYDGIFAFKDTLKSKLDTLIIQIKKQNTVVDTTDSLEYAKFKNNMKKLIEKKENYEKIIKIYKNEILPKIYFNKIWVYTKIYKDTIKAKQIFNKLKEKYPENKYRFAAEEFLKGKKVEFYTPKQKEEIKIYKSAIALMDSLPEKAIQKLNTLLNTKDEELLNKVNFALGYINFFQLKDTLQAKSYFNKVLNDDKYSSFISKFYNGEKFTVLDSLNIPDTLIDKDETNTKKKK